MTLMNGGILGNCSPNFSIGQTVSPKLKIWDTRQKPCRSFLAIYAYIPVQSLFLIFEVRLMVKMVNGTSNGVVVLQYSCQ